MKKILCVVFVLFFVMSCFSFMGCYKVGLFIHDVYRGEDMYIQYFSLEDHYSILFMNLDCSSDILQITVPDEHDGVIINCIGEAASRNEFFFNITGIDNCETNWYSESEAEDIVIIINIGKNLQYVSDIISGTISKKNSDGTKTDYRIRYYFNCSEENECFYSYNGRLYTRSGRNPVYPDCDVGENYTGMPGENKLIGD